MDRSRTKSSGRAKRSCNRTSVAKVTTVVMRNQKNVVPFSLQDRVISIAHGGYQGVTKIFTSHECLVSKTREISRKKD